MLLGPKLSANHISPEGQMSLLGLPIPAPGLYTKNNLNDGLRHRAASTVRDWEPGRTIEDGWAEWALVGYSRMKFQLIWQRDYG